MTEDGTYDLGGETQATGGGTLTFNSDATITDLGSDLEIYYGSTVNIASGQSFSIASVLFSNGGGTLIGGGGSLTVTGSMTWGGGTISGFSTLTIAAGASLTLGDPSSADTEVLDGVTLDNAGSTTLAGSPGAESAKRRLGRQPADREFRDCLFGQYQHKRLRDVVFEPGDAVLQSEPTVGDAVINAVFVNTGPVTVEQGVPGLD